MAPSSRHSRHNVEQRLAPRFVKRSSLLRRDTASILPTEAATPSPSFEPTPSPTPSVSPGSGPPGVTLPPHGVTALISIGVVLSLAILGMLLLVLPVAPNNSPRLLCMEGMGIPKEQEGRTNCVLGEI